MLHQIVTLTVVGTLLAIAQAKAADHGPVFGLGTPTNPKGGWSVNLGVSGRTGSIGTVVAAQAELSYGITENLKIVASTPLGSKAVCSACLYSGGDPFPRSSITLNTPINHDFSGVAWWRFHRSDFAGKRVESTLVGGILIPGASLEPPPYRNLHSGAGYLFGGVTGVASRSQYAWAGATYQRYVQSRDDRRPDLISYTAVYGYRPYSWRTDYPRWDWRIFGEFVGEKGGSILRQGVVLPDSRTHNGFLGPSVLGVYKSVGIEGGMQFAVYHNAGTIFPKERYRFAVNLAYFF